MPLGTSPAARASHVHISSNLPAFWELGYGEGKPLHIMELMGVEEVKHKSRAAHPPIFGLYLPFSVQMRLKEETRAPISAPFCSSTF